MKQTITLYDFRAAFKALRPENFSYDGLEVLFEYLESIEEGTGEEIELDVIALCCDFSEIPLSEILEERDGLISSADAVGELIGRTDHSAIILNS